MIVEKEMDITISRETWDELYAIEYFREVLETIEDIEAIKAAKDKVEYYVDYNEYRTKRLAKINV